MRSLIAVLASALMCASALAQDTTTLSPDELVIRVMEETLRDLDTHRAEYQKHPQRVRELVDKHMLPYFDSAYAAQLVLGKHWRDASQAQRERFIEAFYQSMLQNYGGALLEFTPDRLRILPLQAAPNGRSATVRSEVRRHNGSRTAMNFSLHETPQGWKTYDVTIEGVSYVKSFRTDFAAEIRQKGMEAVIQRLESQTGIGAAVTKSPEA